MPVEYAGTTPVAARLLRYTVKPKPGQTVKERVLHIAGQHCRPETAEREFAATRRKHGTQGATRRSPSMYLLAEPGEEATHVRRSRPNGRRYWDPAKSGEVATHVRHQGAVVRQAEARHLITSFGVDEVNPEDQEQVARAFEYVVARHAALYPGEQAMFVGQAEGKGGKFHVHTTRNATLYQDMEVDGRLYKAGRKLAGDVTDVDKIRSRADGFLAEHGQEFGLGPQRLPSAADRKLERRSHRDRRAAAAGAQTTNDKIREAFETAMDDPRSVDLASWKAVMAEHDVIVTEPGWRRGKPPKVARLSYQVGGTARPVRGQTLGDHFDHSGALEQLQDNAHGRPRRRRPEPLVPGPPRPIAQVDPDELEAAQEVVERIAREERELRAQEDERRGQEDELYEWAVARADAQGVVVGDVLDRLPDSLEARRRVMRLWSTLAEQSDAAEVPEDARTDCTIVPEPKSPTLSVREDRADIATEESPVAKTLDPLQLEAVIIDQGLVKYDIYMVNTGAMYRAGTEPRVIGNVVALWNSLSADEQRLRYQEQQAPNPPADQKFEKYVVKSGDSTDVEQARIATAEPAEAPERRPAERVPVPLDEEVGALAVPGPDVERSAHAEAARRERLRRDALRRRLLELEDVDRRGDELEGGF